MSYRMMMTMTLGGLALAAGCVGPGADPGPAIAADPPSVDTDPGSDPAEASLILRIEVEPGHAVSFYEPVPGGLYLAERRAAGQRFALGDREVSDALAAFARLRPGEQVPGALRAAYDRAVNLPSEPAGEPVAMIGGGQPATEPPAITAPGVIEQALTSSAAASNFVNVDGGCNWGPTRSACRVNWGGGFFASWNPATSGLCIVDHYSGNGVTIQITVGAAISSTFQAVHTSVQYGLGAPGAGTTRRLDVLNAAGDDFHAGCRWGV